MYGSSLKSAEDCPNYRNIEESIVEVWCVIDRSVVYKILMVRMFGISDNANWRILECTGLDMIKVEML